MRILSWIKNLFNSGCVDYTKPYAEEQKLLPKSDSGFYIDGREPTKRFKVKTNKDGDSYKTFDDGRTEPIVNYGTIAPWTGSAFVMTHNYGSFSWPGESNIGYHNSRL